MANGMLSQAAQAAGQVPPPGGAPGGAPPGGAPPGTQGQPAMPVDPGAPVPPPQAGQLGQPGGRDTVGPGSPMPGMPINMPGEGPAYQGEEISMEEEPATGREQAEYERAVKAMERILYGEDRLADAVMKQIDPNDKVSSTTKATALLIQQLDEKIDLDEIIIPQLTMDAVDTITELAEARYGIPFSEQETQATMGATWESVMAMFGVDEDDYNQLRSQFSNEDMDKLRASHQGFLGQGSPVAQNAPPAVPAPAPPGAAPGGPVPMAGPPGAAPGGPAPMPGGPPGAPVPGG